MPMELTPAQRVLAAKLSEHAKDACALVGLECKKCEPQHFYLTIYRYYGKVPGMTAEIDRCIDWCISKGKLMFTAQRFGKWCSMKANWEREEELRSLEETRGAKAQR